MVRLYKLYHRYFQCKARMEECMGEDRAHRGRVEEEAREEDKAGSLGQCKLIHIGRFFHCILFRQGKGPLRYQGKHICTG